MTGTLLGAEDTAMNKPDKNFSSGLVVARSWGEGEDEGQGKNGWSQNVQTSSYKINKSWDVMYSMATRVNNTVLHI